MDRRVCTMLRMLRRPCQKGMKSVVMKNEGQSCNPVRGGLGLAECQMRCILCKPATCKAITPNAQSPEPCVPIIS